MADQVDGPEQGDAFGHALLDRLGGMSGAIVVERDDGFVEVDGSDYFTAWDERDSWVLDRVRGRALDVGAGAGRASLALQDRGHDVVALDVSAGAVEVCRRRGVENVVAGRVEDVAASGTPPFDSAIMLGNNLGLLASPQRAADLLDALSALVRPGGLIAGTCLDPYQTDKEVHLAYHERNRRRGRMPGQVTIRVRYQRLATSWFELLWMSADELGELAAAAGWRITDILPGAIFAVTLARK